MASRRRRSSRPTQDSCYFKESAGLSCSRQPRWLLQGEHGNKFKVCDEHLAWGIRFSGAPAKVTEHEPVTQESVAKYQAMLDKNKD